MRVICSFRFPSRSFLPLAFVALLSGCAAPISISQQSLKHTYIERNRSALSGSTLSNTTHTILQRQNLLSLWRSHPTQAIAALRTMTQNHFYAQTLPDQLFALSELSYQRARKQNDRALFMAAALYAYAYLNPTGAEADRPSPYDRHFRQACDMYMLGLTEALGAPIVLTPQQWALPFGSLTLSEPFPHYRWFGHDLTDLRPLARLKVSGIQNVYSHMGLGEPVAALPHLTEQEAKSFQVSDRLRVPLNLLLTFETPRQQVLKDSLQAQLKLTAIEETNAAQNQAPLQYDQTAARALSLTEGMDWSAEYKGFLDGRLFDQSSRPQLITIEPHRSGHRPVVLVHGTASSAARWADMVNDLLEDPNIRNHYEFWFFSYATGNPIPYSALQLRKSLDDAVKHFGGVQSDPALGKITLIGHSQGGLLIKLLAVHAQDKLWNGMVSRPLESLNLSSQNKTLLRDALFPEPMPSVKSVVFISTPQHGSYIAGFSIAHMVGRMVTFPLTVTEVTKAVLTSDPTIRRLNMRPWRVGSVYGMSPRSSFIKSLATIPVAQDIDAHSIIPVLGNNALAKSDDGVVSYKSAHIEDVNSELVVRHSSHSTQSNPITISEVRRILLQQLHDDYHATPDDFVTKRDIMTLGGEYVPTQRSSDNKPELPALAPFSPAGVSAPAQAGAQTP